MSTNTKEVNVDEILSHLMFLGIVKPYDKLYLSPEMKLDSNCISNSLIRSVFSTDSRDTTLSFIRHTVLKTFDILKGLISSKKKSDKMLVENINDSLIKCKDGICNLQKTYYTDVKFCCDLHVVLQRIDLGLIDLNLRISNEDPEKNVIILPNTPEEIPAELSTPVPIPAPVQIPVPSPPPVQTCNTVPIPAPVVVNINEPIRESPNAISAPIPIPQPNIPAHLLQARLASGHPIQPTLIPK